MINEDDTVPVPAEREVRDLRKPSLESRIRYIKENSKCGAQSCGTRSKKRLSEWQYVILRRKK